MLATRASFSRLAPAQIVASFTFRLLGPSHGDPEGREGVYVAWHRPVVLLNSVASTTGLCCIAKILRLTIVDIVTSLYGSTLYNVIIPITMCSSTWQ
jgi:hypothetical protein